MLETLREFGAINSFAVLLADLLKRYRANCYEQGQVEAAIKRAKNPKQVDAALALLRPILDDYQTLLDSAGHIDFDDMIGKAIEYVREGRFRSPWRYILVDEFQDISEARARLIRYLRDSAPECSLFCVGDDWQAIYRFTGSDLSFTTAFSERFGTTKVTALDLTFRFNNSISDVATRFVLANPIQVRKQLNTLQRLNALRYPCSGKTTGPNPATRSQAGWRRSLPASQKLPSLGAVFICLGATALTCQTEANCGDSHRVSLR
ncbi:UvrD-helicase domain-containing protein [Pseudomonas aeruginosa]|nr:UvrD-helicase domain-containing protein [Pseudomonas aeruginosa]MDF5998058.1 UvrD-helicase domain-containing protein [Pseudomonas aeruginosa]MDW0130730.1 UvrD-helicase domain-containing protein [Pseudomonas aeruginosa]